MKKTTENPYKLSSDAAKRSLRDAGRAICTSAFSASLIFFPLLQMIMANGAPSALYYIVYYIGQLFTLFFFMLVFSFAFLFVRHSEEALEKRLSRKFITMQFLAVFLLRFFLFWAGAFIDDKLAIDFYFSNVTFDGLMADGGASLIVQGIFMFINSFAIVWFVYFLSLRLVKKSYAKGVRRSSEAADAPCFYIIPTVVYFAVGFVSTVADTVMTIAENGVSTEFSAIMTLVLPYVELVVYSSAVFFLLRFLSVALEKKY